jgi:hypothetical protein
MVIAERRLRAPVVVLASVLFSSVATFLLFRAGGLGINLVTLSGLALAFGMSVDNSIVLPDGLVPDPRPPNPLHAGRRARCCLLRADVRHGRVLTPFLRPAISGTLLSVRHGDLPLAFTSLVVALTLTPPCRAGLAGTARS